MNTYLMLTTRTDQFKQKHVAGHYEFSDRLQAEKRLKLFGPFSDATGGAYVIEAGSLEEAEGNRTCRSSGDKRIFYADHKRMKAEIKKTPEGLFCHHHV